MPEKSRFFRMISLFRRNFLRQLPSAFDLRNQQKRKICFLKSGRLWRGYFFSESVQHLGEYWIYLNFTGRQREFFTGILVVFQEKLPKTVSKRPGKSTFQKMLSRFLLLFYATPVFFSRTHNKDKTPLFAYTNAGEEVFSWKNLQPAYWSAAQWRWQA